MKCLLSSFGDKRSRVSTLSIETISGGIDLFGLDPFPVPAIISALVDVFNGSNASGRDTAMALLLRLHAYTGLTPIQSLLQKLRPVQQAEFTKSVALQEEKG